MKSLFIAWQDPQTRAWHTVGRLTHEHEHYRFVYTRGALNSPRFGYLGRMRDLRKCYVSEKLFPLFSNRLLDSSRPEYPNYVQWLGVDPAETDPMRLLARSGGKRATDELCVYPEPEPNERGEIELFFFSHGLRYLGDNSLRRVTQLKPGDPLQLRHDKDNAHDHYALIVETEEPVPLGYCPRYLSQDLQRALNMAGIRLAVEKVNPDAPLQFRLLCKAVFTAPAGFRLFATEAHQPLAEEMAVA
jgi:hypothetical protein